MGKNSRQKATQRERMRKENGRPTAGVLASEKHQSEAEKEEAQGSLLRQRI
jgi:SET domain-containing protein